MPEKRKAKIKAKTKRINYIKLLKPRNVQVSYHGQSFSLVARRVTGSVTISEDKPPFIMFTGTDDERRLFESILPEALPTLLKKYGNQKTTSAAFLDTWDCSTKNQAVFNLFPQAWLHDGKSTADLRMVLILFDQEVSNFPR